MMKWVSELVDGDAFLGELLVSQAYKGITDKGLAYLNLVFQDKTGTIDGKKWDASAEDIRLLRPGNFVSLEGIINLYKGQRQLKVTSVAPINDLTLIDLGRFQRVSPIPLPTLKKRLSAYLESFKDPDVALITKTVIAKVYEKYCTYPAAVRIHHEFGSGILHHSLAMADLAEAIARLYPAVDRDLLVAGALLHDVGKTIEYENPLAPAVTLEGKLLGHISIMYGLFKKIVDDLDIKSEVPLLLEHMILAHHGQLEFGSPVAPMTREALLLSMIDLLDSRMMILDKAMANVKPGESTEKLWMMDNISYYKPKER